jgi:hypothetical protein
MFVGYNKSQIKGTAGTTCTDVQLVEIINSTANKVYIQASYLHNSTYNEYRTPLRLTCHRSAEIINTNHSACMFRSTDYSTDYLSLIHAALQLDDLWHRSYSPVATNMPIHA